MRLTKKIKEKIKEHAMKEAPRECCGLIVSNGKDVGVFPCNNNSSRPEHHFVIPPRDYVRASSVGKTTNGFRLSQSSPSLVPDLLNLKVALPIGLANKSVSDQRQIIIHMGV